MSILDVYVIFLNDAPLREAFLVLNVRLFASRSPISSLSNDHKVSDWPTDIGDDDIFPP